MAIGPFFGLASRNKQAVTIQGSFAPNGSSAVSSSSVKGNGFTVARTSTGQFTLTFTDKFADLISAVAVVQLASTADTQIQVGTWTSSAKTLVLTALTAGSAADISANANNRVHFAVTFNNSSATLTKG